MYHRFTTLIGKSVISTVCSFSGMIALNLKISGVKALFGRIISRFRLAQRAEYIAINYFFTFSFFLKNCLEHVICSVAKFSHLRILDA